MIREEAVLNVLKRDISLVLLWIGGSFAIMGITVAAWIIIPQLAYMIDPPPAVQLPADTELDMWDYGSFEIRATVVAPGGLVHSGPSTIYHLAPIGTRDAYVYRAEDLSNGWTAFGIVETGALVTSYDSLAEINTGLAARGWGHVAVTDFRSGWDVLDAGAFPVP